MDDMVYKKNRLCPVILGHIYSCIILKLGDFMVPHSGGSPQFVILQAGETCA